MNDKTISEPGTITSVTGEAVVARNGEKPIKAEAGLPLQANDLLFIPAGAEMGVSLNDQIIAVNENCVGCIDVPFDGSPNLAVAQLSAELAFSNDPSDDILDIDAIQAAILDGVDPTEILEATAAGAGPQGSAIGTTATVVLNLAETIAATRFVTQGQSNEEQEFEFFSGSRVYDALGGEVINTTVSEGNQTDGTYPQQTVTEARVVAATLSLQPGSFAPIASSLNAVLNELNAEVTSSGKPVVFSYDSSTNTIIGLQDGETVLTIDIDAVSSGKDVILTLTTTLEKPIDHDVETGSQGLVRFSDNLLQIDLSIQGEDSNGKPLRSPVEVTVSIVDGVDQTALDVKEQYTESDDLSAQNPYQVEGRVFEIGSDALETVRFDSSALEQLDGLLSNNQETEARLSDDGKTLTLSIKGNPDQVILEVTLDEDGTYSITQNLLLEQSNSADSLEFAFPVTSIDYDGDVVTNVINYSVLDGDVPFIVQPDSKTVYESKLDDASDKPVVTGVLATTSVDTVQHFEIDTAQFNAIYKSLLTSDGKAVTLSDTSEAGSFTRTYTALDSDGETIFTIVLKPDGNYTFELLKPLDHLEPQTPNTSDNNLFDLNFPIFAVDTDGDKSDSDKSQDGAQATTLTVKVVDDVSTVKERGALVFETTEALLAQEGTVTDKKNVFTDVSQDGSEVTHFIYDGTEYQIPSDDGKDAEHLYDFLLTNQAGDEIGTLYITKDGDISFKPNSDIDHAGLTGDILTAELEVFTEDGDGDVASTDVTLKIKDGDDIGFNGQLDVAFKEIKDTQIINQDVNGKPLSVGLVQGSDKIKSVYFVEDTQNSSALNSITVAGVATNSFVTDDGKSYIVYLGSDPTDSSSYVLKAEFVEDAQGHRNGEYTITQYQSFDNNNNTDTVQLVFPIAAIDNDGDVTPTNINVTIADGNNISVGNENSRVELIETVNLDGTAGNAISKSTSVEFAQESDVISSVKWEVSDELNNDLLLLTTNGKPTFLEISDGLIHLSTYNENNVKIDVLKIELDADNSGKYTVTQYLPIDNADANFNELVLDLVATDVDGDKTKTTTTVSLVDGAENQLKDDEVSLREQVDADGKFIQQTETGDVELVSGADGVKSWIELIDQESVEKWTSNGKSTQLITTDTSVLIEDKDGNKLLEIKYFPEDEGINKAGTYTVTQYGPIDQLSNDLSQLDLKVTAISPDDKTIEKTITVKLQDGDAMSTNGATIDPLVEPLLSSSVPAKVKGQIDITNGTDAVKKITFSLNDDALLDDLTSSGQELMVVSKSNVFTFYIKDPDAKNNQGEKALEIKVNKDTGVLTVKQYLPLDNNSDGDGDDDQTSIKFDITVTDTDGDKVEDSFDLVLQDGQDPQIIGVEKLTVLESALDTGNVAKAQSQKIVFDDRSDNIETINVVHGEDDNYPIILTSGDSSIDLPLKSSGNEVLWRPTDSGYEGYISINGQETTVLEITINSDFTSASFGQVDVELHLPIDHPIVDESDILNIKVPIRATDFDGDVSDVKYLEIGIKDTVPQLSNQLFEFDVFEGENGTQTVIDYTKGDGLAELKIEVSDPDADYSIENPIVVTSVQINNSDDGAEIHREAVWGKVKGSDQPVEIGYLILIKSANNVEVKFEASSLIDHDKVVSHADFTVTATDKDGDTDTGSININIKDAEASLDVKPIQGLEDASYLLLGMAIELPDNDGEKINSIKFSSEVTGGDFYYKNGSEYIKITPDTALLAADLDLTTVGTTISVDNIFFKPNAEYSSDGEIISTKVTVNLSGENHTDQSIESDVKISIEGQADLPTKDASYQDKTSGNEDTLIQLNFAYTTQDQAKYTNNDTTDDTPETIVYTLSVPDGHILVNASGVEFRKDNGDYLFVKNSETTLFDPTENLAGVNKLDDLSEVYLKPIDDYSGSVKVEVTATSHERYSDDTASQSSSIIVDVAPIVDEFATKKFELNVERVRVKEDTEFKLQKHIKVNELGDSDNSESRFVCLKGLPDGTIVTNINDLGHSVIIVDGLAHLMNDDGSYVARPLELFNPTKGQIDLPDDTVLVIDYTLIENGQTGIIPAKDSNVDFDFDVTAIVIDKAKYTDINGDESAPIYDMKVVDGNSIAVDIKGVADNPKFEKSDSSGWEIIKGDATDTTLITQIKTSVEENSNGVPLDFSIIGGEIDLTDKSEIITLVIYSAAENKGDYSIVDTQGNELKLTYVGIKNGQAQYEIELEYETSPDRRHEFDLSGIQIVPAENSTKDIHLVAKVVVTESDGNEKITETDITIEVTPKITGFEEDDDTDEDNGGNPGGGTGGGGSGGGSGGDGSGGSEDKENSRFDVRTNVLEDDLTRFEDEISIINWYPDTLADQTDSFDSEYITEFKLLGGADSSVSLEIKVVNPIIINGVTYSAGETYIFDGTQSIAISKENGQALSSDDFILSAKVPEDSSADFSLNSKATVNEIDVDDPSVKVSKEFDGQLSVVIKPVVEVDGKLQTRDYENKIVFDREIQKVDDTATFYINSDSLSDTYGASDFSLSFSDLDIDSQGELNQDEIITKLVVDFGFGENLSDAEIDILGKILVTGAINNGDGTWTVVDQTKFSIKAPNGLDDPLNVNITAKVVDFGEDGGNSDNSENDESEKSVVVLKTTSLILEFKKYVETDDKASAPIIESQTPIVFDEDGTYNLLGYLQSSLTLGEPNSRVDNQYILVLDLSDSSLPVTITAADGYRNFVNDKLSIELKFGSDGKLLMDDSLSAITLRPDVDFSGNFSLPVSIVTTNIKSGHELVTDFGLNGIQVQVTPQVDGVNTQMQVNAVEDMAGGISIDINQLGFKDTDTDANRGVESFTEVSIAPPLDGESLPIGSLVDISANYDSGVTFVDGVIHIVASQLPDNVTIDDVLASITYHPPEHYSGTVNLTVTGKVVDSTVGVTSEASSFESKVVVNIASQVDGISGTTIVHDNIVEGMAQGEIGEKINLSTPEDTALSLSKLSFALQDQDGSEEFVSFKLTGLPEDFLVQSTSQNFSVSNNGNGEWSIKIKGDLGYSTTLDGINIIPPENFSGTTEIKYVVFTQEKDTQTPIGQQGSISLTVEPQGDDVDTRIGTTAEGEEGGFVEIKLDARIVDKELSIASDNEHTENAPETVHITVSNVPDGVNVVIPGFDSDSYSATKELVGNDENGVAQYTWTITTNAQVVNSIVLDLTDTDYNSDFWSGDSASVTVTVRSDDIDGDGVGHLGDVTTQEVSLNITPVNDKPEVKAGSTELSIQEDSLIFITDIVVSDKDEKDDSGAIVSATFESENGVLSFSAQALAAFEEDNDGFSVTTDPVTGSLTVSGAIAAINQLLDGSLLPSESDDSEKGLQFKPDDNYVGEASISVVVNDNGNNGLLDESSISDKLTINIDVSPVNDTPTVSGSAQHTIDEDTPITIKDIQVDDADIQPDSSAEVKVTLSAELGAITFKSPNTAVDQTTNEIGIVLKGTLADINAMLANGVIYTPTENQSGAGKITVTVDDLGNTGTGDALHTTVQEIDITINAVNDDPSVPKIEAVEINEEGTYIFDLLGGVSDVETPADVVVSSFSSDKGATLSIVDGKLTYTAADYFSGTETITYTISDGNGGETTETITVNVAPISNEPTLQVDKNRFYVAMDNSATVSIPLLGLVPALTDSKETLSLLFDSVPDGAIIKVGGVAATLDSRSGKYIVENVDTSNAEVSLELPENSVLGSFDLTVTAKSVDGSALPAFSTPVTITVNTESPEDKGTIIGSSDDDYLYNLLDVDDLTLSGGNGNDILIGGIKDDILLGGEGNDELIAGAGNDVLEGGSGYDLLIGGLGNDILTGGSGSDTFKWNAEDVSDVKGKPSIDKVLDFDASEDILDLSEIFDDQITMDDILVNVQGDNINIDIRDDNKDVVQTIVLENPSGMDNITDTLLQDVIKLSGD